MAWCGLVKIAKKRLERIGSPLASTSSSDLLIGEPGTLVVKCAFSNRGDTEPACFFSVKPIDGRGSFGLWSGVVGGEIFL